MYISASMSIETDEVRDIVSGNIHLGKGKKNYLVGVDRLQFLTLLEEQGVSPSTPGRIAILIKDGKNRTRTGEWSPADKEVRLWPTCSLEQLENNLALAETISKRRWKLPWDRFKDLYTRKLPQYLTVAPPDRGMKFTRKLLLNSAQRAINFDLLHEGKHAIDDEDKILLGAEFKYRAQMGMLTFAAWILPAAAYLVRGSDYGGLLLTGLAGMAAIVAEPYLMYYYSPLEKNAIVFSRAFEKHPKWRSMVSITPLQ